MLLAILIHIDVTQAVESPIQPIRINYTVMFSDQTTLL